MDVTLIPTTNKATVNKVS